MNLTIELNQDTVTQIKKAIEEFEKNDEIRVEDKYWYKSDEGFVYRSMWTNDLADNYRVAQGNFLPYKNYTQDQAKEYFDKRDARRAAETKLRKIIGDMNKEDGFTAEVNGIQRNYYSSIKVRMFNDKPEVIMEVNFHTQPLWRYSSKETAKFINENHADLLKAYSNG